MHTILVVDDSPTMRRMVIATLRAIPDAHFVEANSGLAAIEQLALTSVTLIVLDLNMPDMHGLEFLRFLRAHPAYAAVPVVILTTRDDAESRAAAAAGGASRYMTKPFAPPVLAQVVDELLEREPRA